MGQFIPRTWMTYFDHELGPDPGIGELHGQLTKITPNQFSLKNKMFKFWIFEMFLLRNSHFWKIIENDIFLRKIFRKIQTLKLSIFVFETSVV